MSRKPIQGSNVTDNVKYVSRCSAHYSSILAGARAIVKVLTGSSYGGSVHGDVTWLFCGNIDPDAKLIHSRSTVTIRFQSPIEVSQPPEPLLSSVVLDSRIPDPWPL